MSEDGAFERVVGGLDYPMFVVTTALGDERAGCLVGFATQCSIDPPRFLVCISDKNRTHRVLERGADALVVHVAPRDAAELVELFGGETGDDSDKFARCAWTEGPRGLPILDDCKSWFAGEVMESIPLGDHVSRVIEPLEGSAEYDGPAYPFSLAKEIEPGHEA